MYSVNLLYMYTMNSVCVQVYLTTGLFVVVSWISFIVPPEVVPGIAYSLNSIQPHVLL